MRQRSSRTRGYGLIVLAVSIAAIAVVALWQIYPVALTLREGYLTVTIGILAAAIRRYLVRVAPHLSLAFSLPPTLLAVLLLPPPLAVMTCALGLTLGAVRPEAPTAELALEILEAVLQTTLAAIIVAETCSGCARFEVSVIQLLFIGGLAAFAHYVMGRLLAGAITVLRRRQELRSSWWPHLRKDITYQATQVCLATFSAMALHEYPWALVLIFLPAALYYQLFVDAVALRLRKQAQNTVMTLADIVERRDPFNTGHSSRVAELARRIALRLGLDPEEAEIIYLAAYVHDFGKIGVKRETLLKPGPLTEEERKDLQASLEAGIHILGQLPEFHRGRNYLALMQRYRAGDIDPAPEQGAQLPLGTQIIMLADTFDAMTSDRAYRHALPMEAVLEEVRNRCGILWDSTVVDALLALIADNSLDHSQQDAIPKSALPRSARPVKNGG